jgi:CTD kinase subunit gamma
MQFLAHLRKLNATQQSIQKVVGFAVRYFPGCGEDLWDCIVEECSKGSLNSRINILYFLDSLCETCLLLKSHSTTASGPQYVEFVSRDLHKVVDSVVPKGRTGLPNLTSTKQILDNWRSKRIIDPQKVDDVVTSLDGRCSRADLEHTNAGADTESTVPQQSSQRNPSHSGRSTHLSRPEIQKRIEEDRERHKRLRERRWVQPISLKPMSYTNPQLLTLMPDIDEELPVDIEFDNEWETTSDWNEDDEDAAAEEVTLMLAADDDVP